MTRDADTKGQAASVVMPFGKHRGEAIDDIDSGYLCWCLENIDDLQPDLRAAMVAELSDRFRETPANSSFSAPCPDPDLAAALVASGLRALAKKHHPDVGGDTAVMQRLNAVVAWLSAHILAGRNRSC
jgi:hypothetical protein